MIQALRYTEDLESVGFSHKQAKMSVQIWMDLMDQNFATKADFKEHYFMSRNDLLELRIDFKDRCDEIEVQFNKRCDGIDNRCDRIEAKIDQLENRLIIKLGGMQVGLIAIIGILIGFLK